MMTKRAVLIFLVLVAALAAVTINSAAGVAARKNIELTLKETRIEELSGSGLTLSFHVRMENNSSRNYSLISYQLQVMINEKEYFRLPVSLDRPVELPADSQVVVSFPVRVNYQYLEPYLSGTGQQATCRLAGDLSFQDERKKTEKVALNFRADFPVFKLPEVRFLPLRVRDLTLGGADFDFRFVLGNPNGYDLLIQKISLELWLGDRVIYRGQLAGDKTLTAGESKTYSLPLILDFFEQGRELRNSLEKEHPSFTLKLNIEADSAWGWLVFPLEATAATAREFSR
ncbi:MAG: hypothetical protein QME69_05500 [Candidatus Saccharicenans sp.]|nr:hypothetical protein [Candidatus Saccharicenans sp.]